MYISGDPLQVRVASNMCGGSNTVHLDLVTIDKLEIRRLLSKHTEA